MTVRVYALVGTALLLAATDYACGSPTTVDETDAYEQDGSISQDSTEAAVDRMQATSNELHGTGGDAGCPAGRRLRLGRLTDQQRGCVLPDLRAAGCISPDDLDAGCSGGRGDDTPTFARDSQERIWIFGDTCVPEELRTVLPSELEWGPWPTCQ